jgi:endonuclease YncB( thermonuclease family)
VIKRRPASIFHYEYEDFAVEGCDPHPQISVIETEVRAERRGLWADREPVAPWVWRASKGRQSQ